LREVIRLVQDARKNAGLDVSDRIRLRWQAPDPELAAALAEHGQSIAGEVLAVETGSEPPDGEAGWSRSAETDLGLTFWLQRA